jgi:hypothetical protein
MSLLFTQSSSASTADLTVVINQGLSLQRINTLHFGFVAMNLKCKVKFETSPDGKAYKAVGHEQVLYQEVSNGKITSLLDAALGFAPQQYVRITFLGAGGCELKEIIATSTPQPSAQRGIPVTLGPMAAAGEPGKFVWPLKFAGAQDLVLRLELHADAPGTAREIAIAALDAKIQPLRTIARFVWADRIMAGGIERSEFATALPGLDPNTQYGVVTDAGDPVFALTAVKAYTNDVWLVFNAPASTNITLWLYPAAKHGISHQQYDASMARDAGAIGPLASLARPAIATKSARYTPKPLLSAQAYLEQWWRAYAYGAGAFILLSLAVALLRKRYREADD